METLTGALTPGLGSGKDVVVGLDKKDVGADPFYMWERAGMQKGFLDDLQGEVSISGWLLSCILDATISEEVSLAVNCFGT